MFPARYNAIAYNTTEYNHVSGTVLRTTCVASMSAGTDNSLEVPMKKYIEAIFLGSNSRTQMTNKRLTEGIRLDTWTTLNDSPPNEWENMDSD